MAARTGEGSSDSDEHAEPECTETPGRSSPRTHGLRLDALDDEAADAGARRRVADRRPRCTPVDRRSGLASSRVELIAMRRRSSASAPGRRRAPRRRPRSRRCRAGSRAPPAGLAPGRRRGSSARAPGPAARWWQQRRAGRRGARRRSSAPRRRALPRSSSSRPRARLASRCTAAPVAWRQLDDPGRRRRATPVSWLATCARRATRRPLPRRSSSWSRRRWPSPSTPSCSRRPRPGSAVQDALARRCRGEEHAATLAEGSDGEWATDSAIEDSKTTWRGVRRPAAATESRASSISRRTTSASS